jgi:hypothetical protein
LVFLVDLLLQVFFELLVFALKLLLIKDLRRILFE